MPRPLPPYPSTAPYAATLAELLARLDDANHFQNAGDPAQWTLPLIREETALALPTHIACAAQLWIIPTVGVAGAENAWAILAATRSFGQVDSRGLTVECLQIVLRESAKLNLLVRSRFVTTRADLATRISSAQAALGFTCRTSGSAPSIFLQRVGDALAPLVTL